MMIVCDSASPGGVRCRWEVRGEWRVDHIHTYTECQAVRLRRSRQSAKVKIQRVKVSLHTFTTSPPPPLQHTRTHQGVQLNHSAICAYEHAIAQQ
jgi:hypothetical protein